MFQKLHNTIHHYVGFSLTNIFRGSDIIIISTFFHELNHALENCNSDTSTSFYSGDKFNKHDGIALNEIITEMKATRLVSNNDFKASKNKSDRYVLETTGYKNTIFIGTMLCASLGINQLDFLKAADKGKQNFVNTLSENFSQKEDCENFMNSISFYSDQLHAIIYRDASNDSPEDKKEAHEAATSCISDIYTQCLQAMEKTMLTNISKNKNTIDMNEYMKKCRFNLERLTANYKHGIEINTGTCNIDLSENSYLLNLQKRILAIETIFKQKESLTSNQYDEALSNISSIDIAEDKKLEAFYKTYDLTQPKTLDKFDETITDDFITKMLKEEHGEYDWPNHKMTKHIDNFLKMNTWTYKTFTKAKEYFLYLKQKKQHYSPTSLPPASKSVSNPSKELEELSALVNDTPDYESNSQNISVPNVNIKKVDEERQ